MSDATAVTRAVATINKAIQVNMFPLGVMPESDEAKLIEFEKLVAMARQAFDMAVMVGPAKVPKYPDLRDILFEAEVLGGSLDSPVYKDAQPQGVAPSPPSTTPQPPAPSPPPSASTTPAPPSSASATTTPSPSPSPASAASPAPASSSPSPPPQAAQPEQPGEWLNGPQPGETWSSMGAGEWSVDKMLADGMLEVTSLATGETTVLPKGFLKDKIAGASVTQIQEPVIEPTPPAVEPVIERIELVVVPAENKMLFTHPGCATWMVPLDDVILPQLNEREDCAGCGMPFPLTKIDDGGYVPSHQEVQPSSPSPQQSQPEPPPAPASTSSSPPPSDIPASSDSSSPEAPSSQPPSEPSPSGSTGAPVDDDGGDPEYAKLLDAVDADFTPVHFPVPQDLENPPELMPEDLTLSEIENRRLHSQYNALSARARYLWAIDHAKAKRCARVVKTHMKPAMRAARHELGKDATVAEVKLLAEENEAVTTWTGRQEFHSDRADAYSTFFEIYAENVKTLSRDLTYAGTEQEGS